MEENAKNSKERRAAPRKDASLPAVSLVLNDGRLVELLRDADNGRTSFAVWRAGQTSLQQSFTDGNRGYRPYSATNNILRHKVVLLPSGIENYENQAALLAEICAYIGRYVDLTPAFTRLVAHYVLLTWCYDRINELPYLRLRGDYGSGKTRFLLVVGALCYKPIFANGASTVSPLFHLLDRFGGTLILDEADFRFSDEKADMVKILNAGNVRGMPILRTMMNGKKEFDPRAFSVFGPKIIAGRGRYDDPALESRCITEVTGNSKLRPDIPINLPDSYAEEALALRNKLLLYRFRNFQSMGIDASLVNPSVDNRINQIYLPLLSIAKDPQVREELMARQLESQERLAEERGEALEAQILEIIRDLLPTSPLRLRDIAAAFQARQASDFQGTISSRFIGTIIRDKLQLRTRKSHGVYVVPESELPKLDALFTRYGLELAHRVERVDKGEMPQDSNAEPVR